MRGYDAATYGNRRAGFYDEWFGLPGDEEETANFLARLVGRADIQNVVQGEDGTTLYPVGLRNAWPSELDLMVRLSGLRLRDRLGGWRREHFTASSTTHVSVYDRG